MQYLEHTLHLSFNTSPVDHLIVMINISLRKELVVFNE